MPWFPDFLSATELARMESRDEGRTDPVAQYVRALTDGTSRPLEAAWPGHVVVYDPRAGEVRGHRKLQKFVADSKSRLAEHGARVETVASMRVPGRAVVELLVHLSDGGGQLEWPVAVVAESKDDLSVDFRTYCSLEPIDGRRHMRPPILDPGSTAPGDVVGRYHAALDAGDVDAAVSTFAPDGYYRESTGAPRTHRGADQLRQFFTQCFSTGGGIGLTPCAVTDDGLCCAVEYSCAYWGGHRLPPQAGIGVYKRSADGLIAAARIYDDIEAPDAHG
ncbi:MAG TPA: nuclear transport factor 2 family protein [Jatrophihabitans sp.]|jgi:hypothetical protein